MRPVLIHLRRRASCEQRRYCCRRRRHSVRCDLCRHGDRHQGKRHLRLRPQCPRPICRFASSRSVPSAPCARTRSQRVPCRGRKTARAPAATTDRSPAIRKGTPSSLIGRTTQRIFWRRVLPYRRQERMRSDCPCLLRAAVAGLPPPSEDNAGDGPAAAVNHPRFDPAAPLPLAARKRDAYWQCRRKSPRTDSRQDARGSARHLGRAETERRHPGPQRRHSDADPRGSRWRRRPSRRCRSDRKPVPRPIL